MELAPVPRRRWSSRWRAVLALVVLAPVVLLAMVPTAFGLERYIVSGDQLTGALGRGAVVFEKRVPTGDLRVGDVVTYPRGAETPGDQGDTLVTRRIEAISDDQLVTVGDRDPVASADRVPLADRTTMSRVVLAVPWVGYPFLSPIAGPGWSLLMILLGVGLGLGCARSGRSPVLRGRVAGRSRVSSQAPH